MEFCYYFASFFMTKVGSHPGPATLSGQQFLLERAQLSPEEAAALSFIGDVTQYGLPPNGFQVTGQPEEYYSLFQKIGLEDGDLITPDTIDDVLSKMRSFLKEKGKLDYISLEASNPYPEEAKARDQRLLKRIRKLKWAGKIGLGWLGACTLAKCCSSHSIAKGLLTLGGASSDRPEAKIMLV